jgi:multiple sugar transport system permease protein
VLLTLRKITNYTKYILFLPGFFVLLFITIFPLIFNYVIMFFRWKLVDPVLKTPVFVGLDNFIYLFSSYNRFWDAWYKTALYTVIVVPIEFALGLVLALALNKQLKGERVIKTMLLLPLATAPIMVGALWRIMYNPVYGIINYFLSLLNLPPQGWVSERSQALISVAIVDIWQWTPFVGLVLLAGLTSLPKEPMEQASIDGASSFKIFMHITLPLLKNVILIIIILRIIDAIKTFDYLYSLSYGGPGTATTLISYHLMLVAFKEWEIGMAAAESIITAMISTVIIMFFFRLMRGGK